MRAGPFYADTSCPICGGQVELLPSRWSSGLAGQAITSIQFAECHGCGSHFHEACGDTGGFYLGECKKRWAGIIDIADAHQKRGNAAVSAALEMRRILRDVALADDLHSKKHGGIMLDPGLRENIDVVLSQARGEDQ